MLFILDEELDVVDQMQVLDRQVFQYLCRRTNWKTGVIGKADVCKVSYGGMSLDLSERSKSGRRSVLTFSSADVRNSVRRLIKEGVLASLSGNRKGCDLMLARPILQSWLRTGKSVQNIFTISLPFNNHVNESEKDRKFKDIETNRNDSLPFNNRTFTTTPIQQHHQQGAANAKSMSLDWKPNANVLATMFHMAFGQRITPDRIDPFWKTEWISYWWSRPDVRQTDQQWNRKYATAMIRYLKKPGLFEKLHGLDEAPEQVNSRAIHKPYVETTRNLPEWAKIPKDDDKLVIWGERHGYGHGPNGYNANQLRAHYRKMVAVRLEENKLPKIIY